MAVRTLPLVVEVADTERARSRGLAGRRTLPTASAGMLFLFERPTIGPFWNRGTLMPLDVTFIDERLHAIATEPLPSLEETNGRIVEVRPPRPYVAVLETPRGLLADLGFPKRGARFDRSLGFSAHPERVLLVARWRSR